MKRVIQVDDLGCGIACVAMLTCRPYDEIRGLMFRNAAVERTKASDLKGALQHYGMNPGYRTIPLKSPKVTDLDLGCDAILKSKWTFADSNWHWVVWDAMHKCILDPRCPPYPRYLLCSYLKVQR